MAPDEMQHIVALFTDTVLIYRHAYLLMKQPHMMW